MISTHRSISLSLALGALSWLAAPATAQLEGIHDNFDGYTGPVDGNNNWEPWGAGAGASVSSAQSFSPNNSVDINGGADLVRQFNGRTSGHHTFTIMQYIPSGLTAKAYFILMSSYGTAGNKWAVQCGMNPTSNMVELDAGGGQATTAIKYDQWVELRCEIYLDQDWCQLYYDGTLLDSGAVADHPTLGGGHSWTGGPFGGSNGPLNIGNVDLYANNSSPVYYDDMKLIQGGGWCDDMNRYTPNGDIISDPMNNKYDKAWEGWGGSTAVTSNWSAAGEGRSGNPGDLAMTIDNAVTSDPDIVHPYNKTSGTWEYTAYQYIPSTQTGSPYFILMNGYPTFVWMLQVKFNPATGMVEADAGGAQATAPIVFDEWIQLRTIIYLDDDWIQFSYNGQVVDAASVPDHPDFGGGHPISKGVFGSATNAQVEFQAVDLYSNSSSRMLYDDITLRPVHPGSINFGTGTTREGQTPSLNMNSSPTANNFTWALEAAGPRNSSGFRALALGRIVGGFWVAQDFQLWIDPSPVLELFPITSDDTGYNSLGFPLQTSNVGLELYVQDVWVTGSGTSASPGLFINVYK